MAEIRPGLGGRQVLGPERVLTQVEAVLVSDQRRSDQWITTSVPTSNQRSSI
ncbi:hypothetical protein [Halomonas sp. LBP4]|uniref:hypothetical protein n=1 Tax=Halomonas sp. LBP4 TaxID=2044917 RepID=UPI0015E8BEA6|nr:hypothetical protein [Halomonas sp. LBP4]